MANCVHHVAAECPLPNGDKMIRGTFTLSANYYTDGDALNLSNYFKSAGYPTVIVDSANGFCLRHDSGTAAAGKIVAVASGANAGAAVSMLQATVNSDLSSINTSFVAIGPAY